MVIEAQSKIYGYSCEETDEGLPSREYIIVDVSHNNNGHTGQVHLNRKSPLSPLNVIGAYCERCHTNFQPTSGFITSDPENQEYFILAAATAQIRGRLLCIQALSGEMPFEQLHDFYKIHAKSLVDPQALQLAYRNYLENPQSLQLRTPTGTIQSSQSIFTTEADFQTYVTTSRAEQSLEKTLGEYKAMSVEDRKKAAQQLSVEIATNTKSLREHWQAFKKSALGIV